MRDFWHGRNYGILSEVFLITLENEWIIKNKIHKKI